MKSFFKKIIILICKFISYLCPPSFVKKISFRFNQLYTYWLSNEFKTIGEDAYIERPIYVKGGRYISIGKGFTSLARLRIECWDSYGDDKFTPSLNIGNNVIMNYNVHIGCINSIAIGNNVLLGSNILIIDHQHGDINKNDIDIAPFLRPLSTNGPIKIKDNVWIGENVAIMPNVTIEDGCIIGANSVVTKSFPKNSILAGVPAKLIRTLDLV
jgi:acetyltransferase-like isoleucine patch superfamily enzyme